jgi:hypothetical protein
MSYFNEEQQDYMRYLATVPRDQKCVCGWHPREDCEGGYMEIRCGYRGLVRARQAAEMGGLP